MAMGQLPSPNGKIRRVTEVPDEEPWLDITGASIILQCFYVTINNIEECKYVSIVIVLYLVTVYIYIHICIFVSISISINMYRYTYSMIKSHDKKRAADRDKE